MSLQIVWLTIVVIIGFVSVCMLLREIRLVLAHILQELLDQGEEENERRGSGQ